MNDKIIYTSLTMMGLTPFLACAILPLTGVSAVAPFGSLDAVAGAYGLAIISFLSGAQWAAAIYNLTPTPFNLLIASNVVVLAVWFPFVMASTGLALIAQIPAFAFLLYVDRQLQLAGLITGHYFSIRSLATALAIISIVSIAIF